MLVILNPFFYLAQRNTIPFKEITRATGPEIATMVFAFFLDHEPIRADGASA
jgi:hypothetical protein